MSNSPSGLDPAQEIRRLPNSLNDQALQDPAPSVPSVKLTRPPAGTNFVPIFTQTGIGYSQFQIANYNPNRVALLVRLAGGTAGRYLFIKGNLNQPDAFPLFAGDDFTLESTGELWVNMPGAPNAFDGTLSVSEVVSSFPQ